jgi:hypothetical protein
MGAHKARSDDGLREEAIQDAFAETVRIASLGDFQALHMLHHIGKYATNVSCPSQPDLPHRGRRP